MDKPQEEMQEIGFFGIYKKSFKTIFKLKKIFTNITLTFILPLSLIFLGHFVISDQISWKIKRDNRKIDHSNGTLNKHLNRTLAYAWIVFWVFKIVYLSCLLLFSLLSTSAVVYTIANLYSGNEVTFKKILKIVPKVWKRLALTFLWTYFGFFIYNAIAIFIFIIWTTTSTGSTFSIVVLYILIVIYSIGFVYITALWQLASVVTVLESSCGLKAMMKSNTLIKGKRWLSWFVFLVLYCFLTGILLMFRMFGLLLGGIVCLFLLMNLFLLGYVVQTMLYLDCKSYHHELIDKMGLSSQLGRYLGDFEPAFKANNDIQLGQPQPHLQV